MKLNFTESEVMALFNVVDELLENHKRIMKQALDVAPKETAHLIMNLRLARNKLSSARNEIIRGVKN